MIITDERSTSYVERDTESGKSSNKKALGLIQVISPMDWSTNQKHATTSSIR